MDIKALHEINDQYVKDQRAFERWYRNELHKAIQEFERAKAAFCREIEDWARVRFPGVTLPPAS